MLRGFIAFIILACISPRAEAQVFGQPALASPSGQKQFGPYTWVWQSESFQPAKRSLHIEARCPAGEVVLGGGVKAGALFTDIASSRPTSTFDGWHVYFYQNHQGGRFTVTVYASCASAQQ